HLRSVELQEEIKLKEGLIAELNAFARTVAHDLKSPLTVVVGYAELTMMNCCDDLEDDTMQFMQEIFSMASKMGRIIDELLTLSSIRQQDVTLHPVNMWGVIKEAEYRLRRQIELSGATITLPDEWPTTMGYMPWLEEVWVNYLSNAIKYGGDPPRIELGSDLLDDGWVRFWICDNGDGISPDQQAGLFAEFERLDQVQVKGHGLGLSIVRRIVEKLGGSVAVESSGQPGEGSVFSFTLRAAD
ncbi:MAG: HAMP domain-containing histidine kinase, partial [Chloroflexi bacterium]|nr:HAMP domain-containing histidine kinase [Chloroflexota bacterium]